MFDHGGYISHQCDCPFLGGWRALLRGGVRLDAGWYLRLDRVFLDGGFEYTFQKKTSDLLRRTCYD